MAQDRPDVTVIIPALNEERTIEEVVRRVLDVPMTKQVIVVNDGSDDRTLEILREFGQEIVVLSNKRRGGKGAAIRQALGFSTGVVVVIQDADLEYFPEEIPSLVAPILRGEVGVVYGTRFAKGMPSGMALPNRIVNKLLVWAVRILFGREMTDEATCYKAVRTDLLKSLELECQRFEFCPEVTAKVIRLREQILEVPVKYVPRSVEAGKKIRWTDAPEAFYTLWRYRNWKGPED
ncbi:MAG: glycosyltransferase family 2 protein [Fimbriimonadaceae bacterium]|nr:MAG: glycosyltransferase family 2 protein [Fimbriimonadaceae bacterium]